jgi:aspartyl-tRNA(Asn)/glutamyl-tRNA(Gln) amidotransferase subunit A
MGSLAIGAESMGGLFDHLAAIPHLTGDDIKLVLASFDTLSAREYFYGARTRATLRRTTARALAGVDLLCLPTTDLLAPSYPASADRRHILDPEETAALCRFSWLGNLTGLPAGSAPVGMLDGLPVGLQFVGDAWDEASVIAALAHVERLELSELPRPRGYAQLA